VVLARKRRATDACSPCSTHEHRIAAVALLSPSSTLQPARCRWRRAEGHRRTDRARRVKITYASTGGLPRASMISRPADIGVVESALVLDFLTAGIPRGTFFTRPVRARHRVTRERLQRSSGQRSDRPTSKLADGWGARLHEQDRTPRRLHTARAGPATGMNSRLAAGSRALPPGSDRSEVASTPPGKPVGAQGSTASAWGLPGCVAEREEATLAHQDASLPVSGACRRRSASPRRSQDWPFELTGLHCEEVLTLKVRLAAKERGGAARRRPRPTPASAGVLVNVGQHRHDDSART